MRCFFLRANYFGRGEGRRGSFSGYARRNFPEPARARAVELLRVGQWFKRLPSDFPIPFEVWEVFVMPHMVTRDYQPPPRVVEVD